MAPKRRRFSHLPGPHFPQNHDYGRKGKQKKHFTSLYYLTLPETNISPEDQWLENGFSFGMANFQVLLLLVLGRVNRSINRSSLHLAVASLSRAGVDVTHEFFGVGIGKMWMYHYGLKGPS